MKPNHAQKWTPSWYKIEKFLLLTCKMFTILNSSHFYFMKFEKERRSYTKITYEPNCRVSQDKILSPLQIKYPVDFDGELKIGDVRYKNMTY